VQAPPAGVSEFAAVAATSGSDVWAVGNSTSGHGLAEHWNGTSWDLSYSSPAVSSTLYGVAAVTAGDVWAVGGGNYTTLTQHWNGTSWSPVVTPNPGGGGTLSGVDAVSANDVWAVGMNYTTVADGSYQPLIEHWDGTSWKVVATPALGVDAGLVSVSAVSASNVWAVGSKAGPSSALPLIEHWNGASWSVVSGASSVGWLNGVNGLASNDVWAVGNDQAGAIIEHWNGTAWSVVPGGVGALPASTILDSVAGSSSTDVWAVGSADYGGGSLTLIEHWNGSKWSVNSSPNISSDALYGVASVSPSVAWAVGSQSPSGGVAMSYGPGTFTSSLSLDPVSSVPLGTPATVSGMLQFSEQAFAGGQTINIVRTNPNGTQTPLPSVTTGPYSRFSLQDTPSTRGDYTYTASFAGDSSRTGATSSAAATIIGLTTTLTVHASAKVINYGVNLTVTGHLAAHSGDNTVSIYREPIGGTQALAGSGLVDSNGDFTVSFSPHKNTEYLATSTGDNVYEPATSVPILVQVRAEVTGKQTGYYASSGKYRLFHYTTSCTTHAHGCPTYTGTVSPNKAGERVYFTLQHHTASGWKTIASATVRLNGTSRARVILVYANSTIIGKPLREKVAYTGDKLNAGRTTHWSYFKVT
jgi:hypothetical protein